jgi:hypothetical protein
LVFTCNLEKGASRPKAGTPRTDASPVIIEKGSGLVLTGRDDLSKPCLTPRVVAGVLVFEIPEFPALRLDSVWEFQREPVGERLRAKPRG